MTRPRRLFALAALVLVCCSACSHSGSVGAPTSTPTAASQSPDNPSIAPMPTFDPSSRVGELAPGFPTSIIPVPSGATVVASSATTKNGLITLTLNLKSQAPAKNLAAFYEEALTKQGFTSVPNKTTSALTSMSTYQRQVKGKAAETIVVGVFDNQTSRLVTISGTVQA